MKGVKNRKYKWFSWQGEIKYLVEVLTTLFILFNEQKEKHVRFASRAMATPSRSYPFNEHNKRERMRGLNLCVTNEHVAREVSHTIQRKTIITILSK